MKVEIASSELIDLLEEWFGNVYAKIKEDDTITEVRVRGSYVDITIGDEEE